LEQHVYIHSDVLEWKLALFNVEENYEAIRR
jgi:hypothetical protein